MALTVMGLTSAIESAMDREWRDRKGEPLPAVGAEDRKLLFAAVARGLLDYLKDHQNEIIVRLTLHDEGTSPRNYTVTAADFSYTKS